MKGRTKFDLVIVPTGGNMANVQVKRLEPTVYGKCRCFTAYDYVTTDKAQSVAFVGGNRRIDPSEASVYLNWYKALLGDKDGQIAFTDASETLSAKDLSSDSFLKKMDGYLRRVGKSRTTARIGVISNPQHAARSVATLHYHGFLRAEAIDSKEPMASLLYRAMEPVLLLLTDFDPDWKGLCVRPLVRSAEKRKDENLTALLE